MKEKELLKKLQKEKVKLTHNVDLTEEIEFVGYKKEETKEEPTEEEFTPSFILEDEDELPF